jgi:phosphoglycolate phosphatase
MAIRGILFDKDGTLIDVDRTWLPVYRGMLAELLGVEGAEADALMAKAGYDVATGRMKAGSIMAGGTTDQLVEMWWPRASTPEKQARIKSMDCDYLHLVEDHLTPLMPLDGLMTQLAGRGLKLGIATNDGMASASRHVRLLGLESHLAAVLTYDTVARPKPSGDMVRRFAEITGFAPAEIAMVGDNVHDMEEARNGGAGLAIAVLSGNAAHGDIAHLADHVLASVAELPGLFGSHNVL